MKKAFIMTAVYVCCMGVAALSFAQTAKHPVQQKQPQVAIEIIRGTIGLIDAAKKEITLKDTKTGKERTFTVSENELSFLKIGESVKVKVKAGSSIAESVKAIKPKHTKK